MKHKSKYFMQHRKGEKLSDEQKRPKALNPKYKIHQPERICKAPLTEPRKAHLDQPSQPTTNVSPHIHKHINKQ